MASKTFTFAQIRGQDKAKRAIEIAVAGGHHLALVGPRGCGKSALAAAYSNYVASERGGGPSSLPPQPLATAQTAAPSELGDRCGPTIDLNNYLEGGLLVLDDLDRFQPGALAAIRDCIDSGAVGQPVRSNRLERFQLIATLSVCPCGYGDVGFSPCRRGRGCLVRHQWHALRWFLDVLDLQVELGNTHASDWIETHDGAELSNAQIATARRQQHQRGVRNADLDGDGLKQACDLHREAIELLDRAIHMLEMTGRDCAAALRVARTLADMEGLEIIGRGHMAEALIYRIPRPLFRLYLDRRRDKLALPKCNLDAKLPRGLAS